MENTQEYGVEDLGVTVSDYADEEKVIETLPSLSSAKVVLRNTLKLMNGKNGGGFYVRFLLDAASKQGWLELLIEYPDGSVKNVTMFKNAFRQTDTDSCGVYRGAESKRYRTGDPLDENYNYEKCDFDFAENFSTPTMPIPSKRLWDLIYENYEKIPITLIHKTRSLDAVYMEMAVLAATYAQGVGLAFMDSETHFCVTAADFRAIAENSEWRVSDLRVEFDKLGLFAKDRAGGYQKSKKVNGRHLHFYVIKKQIPVAGGDIIELEDTEYSSGGPSKAELERIKHKKQVAGLRQIIKTAFDEQRPPTAVESQS